MPAKRLMSKDEFQIVRARLQRRMSDERLEIARLVLEDGMTMEAVAKAVGMKSRQAVYGVVKVAVAELEAHRKQMKAMLG